MTKRPATKQAEWKMLHFSLANPAGSGQENVPRLLRRLARSVAVLGAADVHDITYHVDVTAEGKVWPTMTVYYEPRKAPRRRKP